MKTAMLVFSKNLSKIRKLRGLSQQALSELVDISITSIALYEGAKRWPTRNNLAKLARTLNVSELDFFRDEEPIVDAERIPLFSQEQLLKVISNETLKKVISPELAFEVLSRSKRLDHDYLKKLIPPSLALEVLTKVVKQKSKN